MENIEKHFDKRRADLLSREQALNMNESERNKTMLKREENIRCGEESLQVMQKRFRKDTICNFFEDRGRITTF